MADDSDLEAELLQVAGRGSKGARHSGGGTAVRSHRANSDSDDAMDSEGNMFEEEDDEAESEEEDGQQLAGRRRQSGGKKPADKQASEDGNEEFDDGYGSDLIGDEADRARLMAMSELDREMILAERAEQRDAERERKRNAKLLKQRQLEVDQAEAMRSSTRLKKTDTAKKSAMQELVERKRERERKARTSTRQKRKEKRGRPEEWGSEDESLSESEEASEDRGRSSEEREPRGRHGRDRDEEFSDDDVARRDDSRRHLGAPGLPEEEAAEEASYEEAKSIQARRAMLERWVNEPFFERTIQGFLVRLAMGERRDSAGASRPSYMLAEVTQVIEREPGSYRDLGRPLPSPYPFGPAGASTHKWLVVQRGFSERIFPMSLVSNSGVSPKEFAHWQRQLDKDSKPRMTRNEVDAVREKLDAAENYKYTSEDVQRMIEEKRAKGGRVGSLAAERARLQRNLEHALDTGDQEAAARLQEQLQLLQERGETATPGGRRSALVDVNRRNKDRNFLQALHEVSNKPENERQREGADPFSRRKTQPRIFWKTGTVKSAPDASSEPNQTSAEEAAAEEDAAAPTATLMRNESGKIDVSIDVSGLEALSHAPQLARRLLGPDWRRSLSPYAVPADIAQKKRLTLTDYKRRQGLT